MAHLVLSIAVFLAFHGLPSTPLRAKLIAAMGRQGFMWAFSAISTVLFGWVCLAYGLAEVSHIYWVTGPVARGVSALVMLVAVGLAIAATTAERRVLLTAESVLRDRRSLRGVIRITRHPVLWAVGLWGLVHMANNADAPSWLFFGFMTVLALAGTWAIDRRREQLLGEDWAPVAKATSNIPLAAILGGRNRLVWSEIGLPRMALAGIVWAVLLGLHEPVLGVSPLPF